MENAKTVVICDSHPVVRYGLSQMLKQEKDIEVVAEVSNGIELINALATHNPTIVIFDINNSVCDIELIASFINSKASQCASKIIIYTSATTSNIVENAAKIGVHGYLLKSCDFDEVVKAINIVHNNGTLLDPEFATMLIKHFRSTENSNTEQEVLSKREQEVLSLIAAGASNRHIASKLYIGECTVKFHVSSILAKLNVRNRTEAASLAIQGGILRKPGFKLVTP